LAEDSLVYIRYQNSDVFVESTKSESESSGS